MFGRSASQILSPKDEYTFCFANFLIIGSCNASAYCRVAKSEGRWFGIILLFIADLFARVTAPPKVLAPEDVLSENL